MVGATNIFSSFCSLFGFSSSRRIKLRNALQGGNIRKATEQETKAFFLQLSKTVEEQIERQIKFFNSPEGMKLIDSRR